MSEELKPCPLCGQPGQMATELFRKDDPHVTCSNPLCSLSMFGPKLEEWQSRPIEEPLRAELESARATVHNKNVVLEAYRAELEAARTRIAELEAFLANDLRAQQIEDMAIELATLREANRWRNADAELPENGAKVEVYDGDYGTGTLTFDGGKWWEDGWLLDGEEYPTHWRPLPESPTLEAHP